MPIYAYKCAACGHAKDVLQKISDEPLTTCPACGQQSFSKQVTAAGFQLKGSGWYVSDFRGSGDGANSGVGKETEAAGKTDGASSAATSPTTSASPAAPTTAAPAPSAAPASAPAPVASAAPASSSAIN
jgi:putative FmdB family regulatory protein